MGPDQREPRPLVIVDRSGSIVDVAAMNRKGFTKSTEQGELWFVHEETGRILPYGENLVLVSLTDEGRWYRAVIETDDVHNDPNRSGPGSPPLSDGAAKAPKPDSTVGGASAGDAGRILTALCEVIRSRRKERPEGSYTTYLFDAGEEKIRKKTGEEAIELVLARRREEVVSESADLIYHLLVLLIQLEIPLEEVLGELSGRA